MSSNTNKTVPTKLSVAAYIAGIADLKRRKDTVVLKKLMEKVSGEKAVMWGTAIIGFGFTKETYATGREVEMPLIAFSARKNALALYLTCKPDEFKKESEKLGKFKRSVGCIYIRSLADVDMKVLEELCRVSFKKYKK